MGLFDHFPYTNVHELNLDWVLSMMKALEAEWEHFTAGNSLTFADPMLHDISKSYAKNTIVLDDNGNAYVSLQAVPVGVGLQNGDYWLMVFDYEAFLEKVNKNFTARYYRDQYRATAAMAIGDWLTVDDILCKATAAIAIDDVLEVGVNIEHFTIEDFLKAFMQSATQLIQQYKNDIDASELAYRQQLAQDIADTTATLSAQLALAISGATVDSEVIDIRAAADGNVYTTAGNAVRAQVGDLENSVGFMRGPWVRKTIMSNGQQDNSTTRLSMDSRFLVPYDGIIIMRPYSQKYWWYLYNDPLADATKNDGAWSTTTKILKVKAGEYFNIVVAKTTDGTIWPAEKAAMFNYYPSELVDTSLNFTCWKSFMRRRANISVGYKPRFYNDTYRLSTPYMQHADSTTTLSFPNTYRVNVITVDSSDIVLSETGWQSTTQTIASGTYYHLSFRRADDGVIEYSEITNLYMSDSSSTELDYQLAKTISEISAELYADTEFINTLLTDVSSLKMRVNTNNSNIKGIAHRGLSLYYPENTIIAFQKAREAGFRYVEFDVQTTSDGVFVILHDDTINRTARNMDGTAIGSPISINSITYAQALTYDFGIYKGAAFAGTQIPTLQQALEVCRNIGITPIIELKYESIYSQSLVDQVIDIVREYNLQNTCFFSNVGYANVLYWVKNTLPDANFFWCNWTAFSNTDISVMQILKSNKNKVVCSLPLSLQTSASLDLAAKSDYELANAEAANYPGTIQALPTLLSYIYSENAVPEEALYQYSI